MQYRWLLLVAASIMIITSVGFGWLGITQTNVDMLALGIAIVHVLSALATLALSKNQHPIILGLTTLPLILFLPAIFLVPVGTLLVLLCVIWLIVGLLSKEISSVAAVVGASTFAALCLLIQAQWSLRQLMNAS